MRSAVAIRTAEPQHWYGRPRHACYAHRPVMLAPLSGDVPDGVQPRLPAQIIHMPVWALSDAFVMLDSGAQTTVTERGTDVDVPAGLEMKKSQTADADAARVDAREHQGIRSEGVRDHGTMLPWAIVYIRTRPS